VAGTYTPWLRWIYTHAGCAAVVLFTVYLASAAVGRAHQRRAGGMVSL